MLLSVIVPVYNSSEYLHRCIDSIINQTFKDIEVICINDGSTDDSGEILDDYSKKDSRIKVIHQTNKGISATRNVGLSAVNGEYVTFVDSDDWIESDTYETCMNIISDVELVVFGTKIVNGDSYSNIKEMKKYYKLPCEGIVDFTDDYRLNTSENLWNKIFRADIIKGHDISFPVGVEHEDIYFYMVYSMYVSKAFYISDNKYNYYQRDGSFGRKKSQNGQIPIDYVLVFELAMERFNNEMIKEHHGMLNKKFNNLCWCSFESLQNNRNLLMRKTLILSSKYRLIIHPKLFVTILKEYDLQNDDCSEHEYEMIADALLFNVQEGDLRDDIGCLNNKCNKLVTKMASIFKSDSSKKK